MPSFVQSLGCGVLFMCVELYSPSLSVIAQFTSCNYKYLLLQFFSSLPSLQSWMWSHRCDLVKQRLLSHKKPGQALGVTPEE